MRSPKCLLESRVYSSKNLRSTVQKDFYNTICHVWTAPSWQELSSGLQHWSVQPCVRPLDAVHMTAYPGSIPDVVSNT